MPDPRDEEELGELPPFDGEAEDDQPPREVPVEHEPGSTTEDVGLDDTTGEDDPLDARDVELDESDEGWINEEPDAGDLDLGPADAIDEGGDSSSLGDQEEPGVA